MSLKPLLHCPSYAEVPCGTLDRVGAILLAGGQGSRLNISGPKGLFPLLGKSLFQWIVEKIPPNFPLAVMTSPLNHEETVSFFEAHAHFGKELYFFSQTMLPFLDEADNPLPLLCPDGNGGVFEAFERSGLAELFAQKGIDLLTIVPVDNPLAHPADRALIGYARATRADMILKCVLRERPDESMGAIGQEEGHLRVVEYLYLDASLSYVYSYAGMMAMALPFFRQMAHTSLPIHKVRKKPPGSSFFAWKREKFLFDALPHASRTAALCYPREICYAPVKSLDSIPLVEQFVKVQPPEGAELGKGTGTGTLSIEDVPLLQKD